MIRGNLILLGQIVKVANYDGTVAVKLSQTFTDIFSIQCSFSLKQREAGFLSLFLNMNFSGKDTLRVKFNVTIDTKVSEFVGCNIYLADGSDGSLRGRRKMTFQDTLQSEKQ
jgi:hypothetical protein